MSKNYLLHNFQVKINRLLQVTQYYLNLLSTITKNQVVNKVFKDDLFMMVISMGQIY